MIEHWFGKIDWLTNMIHYEPVRVMIDVLSFTIILINLVVQDHKHTLGNFEV